MKHYPKERKDAVIAKMANHPSLPELAKQEGISLPTLYAWRRQAREQGILHALRRRHPGRMEFFRQIRRRPPNRHHERRRNCRILPRPGPLSRADPALEKCLSKRQRLGSKKSSELAKSQRQDRTELKKIQAELRRKEKALAEAAALLVLQKKFNALLEDEEV